VSTVGFVVHAGRPAAVEAADELRAALTARGVRAVDVEEVATDVDLVVAVGGDGTFLRAAYVAARVGSPVLGVKVGRLGFLTEVEPPSAVALVLEALDGRAPVEERLAVVAEAADGASFPPQWAMNEIMVEKRARHRLIRLKVAVGGEYVTTFSADGVIVATPTGSTAYSFSARGPIVSPDVACLVVTPIAAHMVFDRSFVLGAGRVVTLEVVGDEPGLVSADGRETQEIPVGTEVRIHASERPARLVRRDDAAGFLTRVRDKFDLPGEPDEDPVPERPPRLAGDVGGGG
jgi:NAD+ kinase